MFWGVFYDSLILPPNKRYYRKKMKQCYLHGSTHLCVTFFRKDGEHVRVSNPKYVPRTFPCARSTSDSRALCMYVICGLLRNGRKLLIVLQNDAEFVRGAILEVIKLSSVNFLSPHWANINVKLCLIRVPPNLLNLHSRWSTLPILFFSRIVAIKSA